MPKTHTILSKVGIILSKTGFAALLLSAMCCLSCENPYHPDDESGSTPSSPSKDTHNLTLHISSLGQIAYDEIAAVSSTDKAEKTAASHSYGISRTSRPVGEVCTRISFALYSKGTGTYSKTSEVSQESSDANFGTVQLSVPQGSYLLVVVAHSGNGKATMTNPEKITFYNNKVTDTFFCTQDIEIGSDASLSLDLNLRRAVGKVCFSPDDKTPAEITKMQFYYTGGSSTFNAVSGYGCVNSKQTEDRNVEAEAYEGSSSYEIFTFPHADKKDISLQVTAQKSDGTALFQRKFNNIQVDVNHITRCHGNFFGEDAGGGRVAPAVTIDDKWDSSEYDYPFDSPSSDIDPE